MYDISFKDYKDAFLRALVDGRKTELEFMWTPEAFPTSPLTNAGGAFVLGTLGSPNTHFGGKLTTTAANIDAKVGMPQTTWPGFGSSGTEGNSDGICRTDRGPQLDSVIFVPSATKTAASAVRLGFASVYAAGNLWVAMANCAYFEALNTDETWACKVRSGSATYQFRTNVPHTADSRNWFSIKFTDDRVPIFSINGARQPWVPPALPDAYNLYPMYAGLNQLGGAAKSILLLAARCSVKVFT